MQHNTDQNQGSVHSLIDKARKDPQAFVYLFDLYVDEIYRFCLGMLFDKSASQLATLDVFKRAARDFRSFEGSLRQFHNSLYRHAVKALDTVQTSNGGTHNHERDRLGSYKQAFLSLDAALRQVTGLHFIARMDPSETAAILNRNLPLVREQISDSQKKLTDSILQLDGTDPLEEIIPDLMDQLCSGKKMDNDFRRKVHQELAMIARLERQTPSARRTLSVGLLAGAGVLLVLAVAGLILLTSGVLSPAPPPGQETQIVPADTASDTGGPDEQKAFTDEEIMYEYDNILQLVAKRNEEGLIRAYRSDNEITRYLVAGFLGGIGGRKSLVFLENIIEEQQITNAQDPHIVAAEKIRERLNQTSVVISEPSRQQPRETSGQGEPAQSGQDEETAGQEADQPVISGRVLDSGGSPVADLEVFIENTTRQVTRSDEQGRWAFETLDSGLYSLGVVSQMYVLSDVPEGVMSVRIAEGVPTNRDIKVSPAGWISVTVIDPANRPVEQARLYLSVPAAQEDIRQIDSRTLDFDAVEFGPLAVVEDEYYITITHQNYAPALASVVLAEPGETEYLMIQLAQPIRIEGTAQDAFGNPLPGIEIIAVPAWWLLEDLGQGFVTNPDGEFNLNNIPNGPLDIYVRLFDGSGVLPEPVFLERVELPAPGQPLVLIIPDSILSSSSI